MDRIGRLDGRTNFEARLRDFDAILVPGGFGKRGVEGMIRAISYARKTRTPYFGICLGMQTACIEFARNACDLKDADSTEFNVETPYPIIFKLRDLVNVEEMGGTMRLGAWVCRLAEGSWRARFMTARKRSANAIAIVTNSIPRLERSWRKAVWFSAASQPTANLSRSSSFRATNIHGLSAASSIPNSNRSPCTASAVCFLCPCGISESLAD